MPEHVDMHREWQFGGLASPLDHAAYAHAPKGLTALIDKDVGRFGLLLAMEPLKPRQFIALEVMDAIGAALQPADGNGALGQIDVIPAQVAGLRHPQPVPVDQQPYQPIAMPMAVALEGLEQLANLGLGEMLAHPIGFVV